MKKIGVVTFHSSHNFGSALQSYAMCHTLSKMGLDVKMIDFRHPAAVQRYEFVWWSKNRSFKSNIKQLITKGLLQGASKRTKVYHEFIENLLPLTQRYKSRRDIKEHFDYLVCGSDQIWNPIAKDSRDMIYFLDFGDKDTIRFSYAASSGSQEFLKEEKAQIHTLLSRMKGIGVREQFMQEYLRKEYGLDSVVNPDPTIHLTATDWTEIEAPVKGLPENYLLVYSLINTKQTVAFASELARKMNLPVVHINQNAPIKVYKAQGADYSLFDLSPRQFLWLFHHASFVVSNSFHGNMFSIIYRKPFVCPIGDRVDTRITTLHSRMKLGDSRMLRSVNDYTEELSSLDYTPIEEDIREFRAEGIDYIQRCLD